MPPRKYISTEYLFGVLSTSFANRHAGYGYFVSLTAGRHSYCEFSLTPFPQERIPIWDEQSVMETWNNVVLLRRFIQMYTILNFVLYIIGK